MIVFVVPSLKARHGSVPDTHQISGANNRNAGDDVLFAMIEYIVKDRALSKTNES
jgi:hypothetical protein